jgi:hypothetical protein
VSDSRDVRWTVSLAIWALCLIAAFAAAIVITLHAAQEKDPSYPRTRTWSVAETHGNVYIVETAGVCLYLTSYAVAAVPKTQLPKGAGCQ